MSILQKHLGDTADIFEYLRVVDLKTPKSRTNERTRNYLKGTSEDSNWREEDHNRDERGRFAKKNSSGTEKKENNQNKNDGDKIEQLRNALEEMLLKGQEEITVKNVRTDLEQYGGTNDITLKMGTNDPKTNKGSGIRHIVGKHGIEALKNAWYTIVYGRIKYYSKNDNKIRLRNNNDIAILALDDKGAKKTWIITAYNEDEYENKKP